MESNRGWSQCRVVDTASPERNALVGGPFGSNLGIADYVQIGIPVIRGQNLGNSRWVDGDFAYVTPEKAQSLSANLARPGDIVFTQRGTIGQVGMVPDGRFERYLLSQSQMKLTVDVRKAEPLFLYYLFRSPQQQDYLQRNAIQVGVPHTNLGLLRETPILLPPLAEQQAIARLLGSLDDKIELNRRMNKTLETMAQAIFKSWFVDFEPVNAEHRITRRPLHGRVPSAVARRQAASPSQPIPVGWSVKGLDEVAAFLNGLALQKFPPEGDGYLPVIKIAQLRSGDTAGSDQASIHLNPEYIVEDGDVLFSWSGSLEVALWCGGRGALNQHLFRVTSTNFPKWFYYYWTRHHLQHFREIAAGKATTMGHIQRHHLSGAQVLVPTPAELDQMDSVVAPLLDKIVCNNLENRTLGTIRDLLLPKLLCGELRIEDPERAVGTAV